MGIIDCMEAAKLAPYWFEAGGLTQTQSSAEVITDMV